MNRPIDLQTFACTLQDDTTIKEAALVLKKHGAAELPVLNEQRQFVGLLHQNIVIDTVIDGISPEEPIRRLVVPGIPGIHAPSYEGEGRIAYYEQSAFAGLIPVNSLVKENKRLQTMLAMAPMQVWITDTEGNMMFINDGEPPLFTKEEWESVRASSSNKLSLYVSAVDDTYTIEKQQSAEEDGLTFYYAISPGAANTGGEERAELLEMIYEYLYDGIITVDKDGYVTMLSKEYGEFLGVNPKEMIGRHCTEVIENTRMHIVAKTGKPEIADFQKLKTGYMVATRVPIIKNGEITGALGKVLFKNITGVKGLQTRIQQMEKDWKHYKGEWQEQNTSRYQLEDIIGTHEAMIKTKQMTHQAAQGDSNVLLLGESGTGKELFAHALHGASSRAAGPFVKVNCAAIPSDLLESELFGYVDGSFTGARKGGKKGKFEAAEHGTIFLDEIGELPLHMQVKFLRVLQEKEVEKVGDIRSTPVDIRVIAATNRDLETMVERSEFRLDLYYRLNVMPITIPPLRDRKSDILLLVEAAIRRITEKMGKPVKGVSDEAARYILSYDWPGNVRELENVLERAVNMAAANEPIKTRHLPDKLLQGRTAAPIRSLQKTMQLAEKEALTGALHHARGNKSYAAKLLGISRTAFYEKWKRLEEEERSDSRTPYREN